MPTERCSPEKRGTKISGIACSPVRTEKRSEQKAYEIKRNNFMIFGKRGTSGCGRVSEETVYGIKKQNQCRQNQRRDKAPAAHLSGDGNCARRKKRLQNGMKFYMRFHEQHRDLRIFSHFNGCVLESPQVPGTTLCAIRTPPPESGILHCGDAPASCFAAANHGPRNLQSP